jgi:N-acetylglucosamine-6-sulfatase
MDFNDHLPRRDVLQALGSASAAGIAGLALPGLLRAAPQPKRRPNIVFILSDDHRWDYLGCVGHPFLDTRNMDRLAGEGVLFSNAFVTTSLCTPSTSTTTWS